MLGLALLLVGAGCEPEPYDPYKTLTDEQKEYVRVCQEQGGYPHYAYWRSQPPVECVKL